MAVSALRCGLVGAVGNDAQARICSRGTAARPGVLRTFVIRVEAPTATTVVLVNEAGSRQFLHRLREQVKHAFSEPWYLRRRSSGMRRIITSQPLYSVRDLRLHGAEMLRPGKSFVGLTTSSRHELGCGGRVDGGSRALPAGTRHPLHERG